MKAFQTLLFLAVIILIGGMAALYWGKTVEDATVPVEVVEEPATDLVVPIEDELSNEPLKYSNGSLGLTFIYPSEAEATEVRETEGFDTGKRLAIIVDSQKGFLFRAEALSEDFSEGIQEGCCYFLHGTFDMQDSVESLQEQVEAEFRNIFVPRKVEVGGRQGFAFYYASDFISTMVFEAILIPIEHEEFANVLLVSPVLYETEEGVLYDDFVEELTEMFNEIDPTSSSAPEEFNQDRLSVFSSIVESIQWVTITP